MWSCQNNVKEFVSSLCSSSKALQLSSWLRSINDTFCQSVIFSRVCPKFSILCSLGWTWWFIGQVKGKTCVEWLLLVTTDVIKIFWLVLIHVIFYHNRLSFVQWKSNWKQTLALPQRSIKAISGSASKNIYFIIVMHLKLLSEGRTTNLSEFPSTLNGDWSSSPQHVTVCGEAVSKGEHKKKQTKSFYRNRGKFKCQHRQFST